MIGELFVLSALTGYLIGCISWSRLFLRIFSPETNLNNLKAKAEYGEEMKMLSFGANAVSLVLGPKLSMIVALLDIGKVAFPMVVLNYVSKDQPYFLVFSFFALLGNNWPIVYRLKGGIGFSVIIGSLLVVDWTAAIAVPFLGFLAGIFIFGNIGLANLAWLAILAPWLWLHYGELPVLLYSVAVTSVVFISLLPEAKRYHEYSKKGKLDDFAKTFHQYSSMAKGMKKIIDWRNQLGAWRFFTAGMTFILIILFFYLL